MTSPNPNPADKQDGGKPDPKRAPDVAPLAVVEYVHHDQLLNREHTGLGVVFDVRDGVAKVVPLAHHSVQIPVEDLSQLSASDLD